MLVQIMIPPYRQLIATRQKNIGWSYQNHKKKFHVFHFVERSLWLDLVKTWHRHSKECDLAY